MEILDKNQDAILHRIGNIANTELAADLNTFGCSTVRGLLSPEQCKEIARAYPESGPFRSHIHMARHGFGKGEYKYFAYPLPSMVTTLRQKLFQIPPVTFRSV